MRFAMFWNSGPPLVLVAVAATIRCRLDAVAHAPAATLAGIRRLRTQPGVKSALSSQLAWGGRGECGGQGTTSWVCALRPWAACCGRTA